MIERYSRCPNRRLAREDFSEASAISEGRAKMGGQGWCHLDFMRFSEEKRRGFDEEIVTTKRGKTTVTTHWGEPWERYLCYLNPPPVTLGGRMREVRTRYGHVVRLVNFRDYHVKPSIHPREFTLPATRKEKLRTISCSDEGRCPSFDDETLQRRI